MSEKQPGQDDFARSQGYPGVLLASHPLKAEKWEMCKESERKNHGVRFSLESLVAFVKGLNQIMNYMRARQIHPFVDEKYRWIEVPVWLFRRIIMFSRRTTGKCPTIKVFWWLAYQPVWCEVCVFFFLPWLDSHDTQYMFQIPYQMYVWTLRYVM